METAEKVDTSGIPGKLQEVQHVCEGVGDAVPTTIVNVAELARMCIEIKRKNTTMYSRQTYLEAGLAEIRSSGRTMRSHIKTVEGRIKTLKTSLSNARVAIAKLTNESARFEAVL